jgi:ankyrin repeat protein
VLHPTTIRLNTLLIGLVCAIIVAPRAVAKPPALLADAVEQRNTTDVARLLKEGADLDAAQPDGMTAIVWAAYHDDLGTAKQLVRAGANVKAQNRYGVTALSQACVNGNGALVKLLLDHGADPNTKLRGGETALMTAARTGRLEAVTPLLDKGADPDAKEQQGQTALMWAAAEGHADVIDALIQAGAADRTPLKSGFTPLSFAVRGGHIAAAKRLLAAGADVNEAMTEARGGRNLPVKNTSPLLLAMENGHFELATVLLEAGADPNDDRTGFAPLHAMSWIRKPEKGDDESGTPSPRGSGKLTSLDFVRTLVKHGADANFRKQGNGGGRLRISVKDTTPFLCAASTADVDYMKTLLELGADPKAINASDQTALMMAAGIDEKPEGDGPGTPEEHLAAVKFMLELGADVNAMDKNGETAMHGAAYKSLPAVLQLLTDRGADIKIWSRKTKQGRTPLSIAEGYRPGNFKPSFETVEAIKKIMLAGGVTPPPPPDKRDGSGKK